MFLEVDGGEIYYEISEDLSSTKKPVLFVLPGGPGGAHSIYKFNCFKLEEVKLFCMLHYSARNQSKTAKNKD
jgi:hypothetical protein